ncbi:la protein homolog [Dermacentor variabilis]|uniref:la protein homolog n=1 Tax=Dermacentor variabilis TaxID=34621 RepID=UPI003F5CA014
MVCSRSLAMTDREIVSTSVSAIEAKIIKQVEYYFGDFNLSRDKFLQGKIKMDDGWVAIKVLLAFNRLKRLAYEENVVVQALRKSTSQLLEINDDGTKVRRSPAKPVPESSEELKKEFDERSVFVRGFPPTATIDELLEFFGQFGHCVSVFMRRYRKTRAFRGSVFATFSTKDEANAFLAQESVKFDDQELPRFIKQGRQARQDKKAKNEAAEVEAEGGCPEAPDIVLGCLLRIKGLGAETTWESLRQAIEPFAKVAFVDYPRGQSEAVLRFVEEGSAQAVLAKLDAQGEGLNIDGYNVTADALEGDEEVEYWKKVAAAKLDKRNHFNKRRRGRGQDGKRRDRCKKRASEEDVD